MASTALATPLRPKTSKKTWNRRGRHIKFPDNGSVWFSNGNKSYFHSFAKKIISKLVLKRLVYITFWFVSGIKNKFRKKNVQVNHLRKNLPLSIENARWELPTWQQGLITWPPPVCRSRFPLKTLVLNVAIISLPETANQWDNGTSWRQWWWIKICREKKA